MPVIRQYCKEHGIAIESHDWLVVGWSTTPSKPPPIPKATLDEEYVPKRMDISDSELENVPATLSISFDAVERHEEAVKEAENVPPPMPIGRRLAQLKL